MNRQEKLKWLGEFYLSIAAGGQVQCQYGGGWMDIAQIPNLDSPPENWRIKPALKAVDLELTPVDLSSLLDSRILCEFNHGDSASKTGYLDRIVGWAANPYRNDCNGVKYRQCQPLPSPHIHYWKGGECPVPKGVKVKLHLRDGTRFIRSMVRVTPWTHCEGGSDIIGIEFIGLFDGYCWPWEVNK
jgi:hypothetical protein